MWLLIKRHGPWVAFVGVLVALEWGVNGWVNIGDSGKDLAVPSLTLSRMPDVSHSDNFSVRDELDSVFGLRPRIQDPDNQASDNEPQKQANSESENVSDAEESTQQLLFGKSSLRLFGLSSRAQIRYAIFTVNESSGKSDTIQISQGQRVAVSDGEWVLTLQNVGVDSVTLTAENTETQAEDTIELVMFNYEK